VSSRDFVTLSPPSIGDEEIEEALAVLRSGWLTTGPRVARFEADFAAYTGASHAVAVNSCTAALHLSLLASGVTAGDEVVTTPLTFCATANAIIHAGATPVFADVEPESMNLDPAAATEAISARTRAVVPVHMAGRPVDVAAFRAMADATGLKVIEDAAHCVEGVSRGRKIGATADFTCFSFYATKNLTTGEGGMITTNSEEGASFVRTASLHGLSRDAWTRYAPGGRSGYEVVMAGFKYNMSDLQAALGIHQLARLHRSLARREAIWRVYDEAFASLPLVRPAPEESNSLHARHLYTVLVDPTAAPFTRDGLQDYLRSRGIGTSLHFTALHLQPFYAQRFGLKRGMFPNAERISDQTLSLPLSAALTDEEVDRVIAAVHDAFCAPAARVA
jgi:dTDP-4-amino-4,6-dideoxygalactose transaminase